MCVRGKKKKYVKKYISNDDNDEDEDGDILQADKKKKKEIKHRPTPGFCVFYSLSLAHLVYPTSTHSAYSGRYCDTLLGHNFCAVPERHHVLVQRVCAKSDSS